MSRELKIGNKMVGDGHPAYIIAEIGINHNGDLNIAKQMIDAAVHAGVDAVKFQKRTPDIATPPEQQKQMRETPWGYITYLEYRHKVEFNEAQYREIDRHCKEKGITWLVSVWDQASVDFMEQFDTPAYKIPSACLTDYGLIRKAQATGKPLILSSGMSCTRCHDSTTDAKASLISTRSICSFFMPARASARLVAGMGAESIRIGSSARTLTWCTRARGRRPCVLSAGSEATSSAEAPSLIWLETAAVSRPPGWSGASFAIFSSEVSRRGLAGARFGQRECYRHVTT